VIYSSTNMVSEKSVSGRMKIYFTIQSSDKTTSKCYTRSRGSGKEWEVVETVRKIIFLNKWFHLLHPIITWWSWIHLHLISSKIPWIYQESIPTHRLSLQSCLWWTLIKFRWIVKVQYLEVLKEWIISLILYLRLWWNSSIFQKPNNQLILMAINVFKI
jgi:hypothetical protein